MKILAIDGGLRWCGVAVGTGGTNGTLTACALVKNTETKARNGAAWGAMAHAVKAWADLQGPFNEVICETPMQYQHGHHGGKRVDPDDILQLQGVVGALSALVGSPSLPMQTIYPYAWKGQLPKDVCFHRIKSRLAEKELALLQGAPCAESLRHNIGDAVGIYLNAVGRFKK
jgi:hypothetical protein